MHNLGGITNPKDLVTKEYVDGQVSAKYSKPSTGIPKSDLSSGAQTSLDKADRATRNYELIKTVTLEEAVNSVEITTDDNGDPISLQSVAIKVTNDANAYTNKWIKLTVMSANSHQRISYGEDSKYAEIFATYSSPRSSHCLPLFMTRMHGMSIGGIGYPTTNQGYASGFGMRIGGDLTLFEDDPWIKLIIGHEYGFSAGTVIKIFGVKS